MEDLESLPKLEGYDYGLVKIHQLAPAGYTVSRTIPLSELEAGA